MDHERVNISSTQISCGVLQLSRINEDTEGVLYNIASRLYHPSRGEPAAACIFSDLAWTGETSNSQKLTGMIRQEGFGDVMMTERMENPKTGNIIVVFVWTINHKTFKEWYAKQRVAKLGKVGS